MSKIMILKRGSTYSYRFDAGKTAEGKRKRVQKGGFATRKDAQDAGAIAYADWKHGNVGITSARIRLDAFLQKWLAGPVRQNTRSITASNYEALVRNHIVPILGSKYLQDLKPADVATWMDAQAAEGYSYNTLKSAHTVLKTALSYAVYPAQLISSNPALYIKVPRNAPKNVVKRSIIPPEQVACLLETYPEDHPMHIVLLLLYHTGMRISEVVGLTWEHVQADPPAIDVKEQILVHPSDHKLHIAPPKTRTSLRSIPIDDGLLRALTAWKKHQAENELRAGDTYIYQYASPDGMILQQSKGLPSAGLKRIQPVCTLKTGALMQAQYVFRYLRKEGLNAHSFRHTHATMLIEGGATPKGVAGRLGHAKTSITEDLYTHETKAMQQDTLDVFKRVIKNG